MVETCIRLRTKQPLCQRREVAAQGRPAPLPASRIALKLHLISPWRPEGRLETQQRDGRPGAVGCVSRRQQDTLYVRQSATLLGTACRCSATDTLRTINRLPARA